MALSDFLFNTGNKIKMGLSRFAPKQNYVSPSGDYDPRQFDNYPTWYQGEKVQPRLTMSEMLLGQKAQTPAQEGQAVTDENGNTTLKMGTSEAPRTGGILPDIMSGFDENRNNAFSLNNLEQGTLEDGRKKGFAYKLGEGLGSIARIANTPLGRGLIVGGLVTATGGNPLQALAYGGGATMMNQQNVLKDQMYRNDLANQGIDTTGIRGYLGDNIYSQLLRAKQLKDNAEYRKMYFDVNQANLQANREYQKQQDAIDNYYKGKTLELRERKQNESNKILKNNKEQAAALFAIEQQLNNYTDMFKDMPGKAYTYTVGKAQEKLGLQDPKRSEFDSRTALLFNKIARDLGGEKGVLSDQDIKRVQESMPKYTDSLEQKQAKMKAIYDLLNIAKQKLSFYGVNAQSGGQPEETTNNEGWAF